MTGVLSALVRPLGRSTSAWSFTPSEDGIVASDQVSPAGTSAAPAVAGSATTAASARSRLSRVRIGAPTRLLRHPCGVQSLRHLAAILLLPGTVCVLLPVLLLGDAAIAAWPPALLGAV